LTPGHQTQSNIFDEDLNSQNTESNGESQKDTGTLCKSNSKEQLSEHSKDKEQSKELIVTPKIGAERSTPGVPGAGTFSLELRVKGEKWRGEYDIPSSPEISRFLRLYDISRNPGSLSASCDKRLFSASFLQCRFPGVFDGTSFVFLFRKF
jgi:hypothetical protein